MPDAPLPEHRLDAAELAILHWISAFALQHGDEAALLAGFGTRLLDAGLPVSRIGLGYSLFHPVLEGRGFFWRREAPDHSVENRRGQGDPDALAGSPFAPIAQGRTTEIRRTVGADHVPGEFALLDAYAAEGMRDYLALGVGFGPGTSIGAMRGILLSFQTDRPGGFAAAEVALLRRLATPLGHAVKTMMSVDAGRVLVTTYLGRDAGQRVLDGTIRRGAAEPTTAVLWSSDLVGFTRIADTAPRGALIPLLNDYADAVVGAITAEGGEVLKFIGDGILAIFPFGGAPACGRALDAAEAALAAVGELSARRAAAGQPHTGIHLALHVGEVLYGNIGSRERLDFTVVGPAVNELARIEAMCRTLDQPLVASSAFAGLSEPARRRLVSLGRYALRGVRRPQELFTVDPETARGASPL
ncbi:MAG: adenylate/guanylate cyclase domain-containing protein [Acetobacteraceae bacterium]|nr:adenylate/guanylate cyclase domain-containing protein [Acetobacteraceae bacterium]